MVVTKVAETSRRAGSKFEGSSAKEENAVVFEDDGATGYFYCLEIVERKPRIVDALHIYNADDVADSHLRSAFDFGWSADGQKAILTINGECDLELRVE